MYVLAKALLKACRAYESIKSGKISVRRKNDIAKAKSLADAWEEYASNQLFSEAVDEFLQNLEPGWWIRLTGRSLLKKAVVRIFDKERVAAQMEDKAARKELREYQEQKRMREFATEQRQHADELLGEYCEKKVLVDALKMKEVQLERLRDENRDLYNANQTLEEEVSDLKAMLSASRRSYSVSSRSDLFASIASSFGNSEGMPIPSARAIG